MTDVERPGTTFRIAFALFLLLIFSLGFMKPALPVPIGPVTSTDLIFLVAILIWVAALATRQVKFRWHPAYYALALYLAALLISASFSGNPTRSFTKLIGEAYLVLLPLMAVNLVTKVEWLRLATLAWIAGTVLPMLIAFAAILLFYVSPDSVWLEDVLHHYGAVPQGNFPRVASAFVSPSMFCNYLTVSLVMLFIAARAGQIGRKLAIALGFAIALSAAFTVSISLGGLFLAVALCIACFSRRPAIRHPALSIGSVVALGFLVIAPFALSSGSAPYKFDLPVVGFLEPSSRYLVWADAVNTFLADPITGRGLGLAVADVTYRNFDGTTSLLTDAHNTFLNIAAQSGIIGLLGIIAVVFVVLRAGFRAGIQDSDLSVWRVGLTIAFISAFIYDGLTGSFENARHLWVLIGLILATDVLARE